MKKFLAIFLSILTVVSLFGCTANETPPETTEAKDYSEYAGIVEDPKTWYDEFMALPIASEDMTEDELRQLCADAFKANLSFTWTPTQDIVNQFTLLEKTHDTFLPKGLAYSGLFYNNNVASGNLWKVLNYYDKETGAVDIEAMGSTCLAVLSSACANGALQGWNRVSNSSNLHGMDSYKLGQSNIVLVGPYTYVPHNYSFMPGDGTLQIIADNGEQVMCESYAAMKTADGLYSSSSWHVMMCSATPVVQRLPDGSINVEESYLLVHEQRAEGTKSDDLNYLQSNRAVMRPLGTVDNKYTFRQLLEKGYVPFTLKELTGEDPVEPGKAWLGSQTEALENGLDLTADELFGKILYTNYALCTVEIQVKNADGEVLLRYDSGLQTAPTTYSTSLSGALNAERLAPYADGKNTVHIYARLANGELLEAFSTVLKLA